MRVAKTMGCENGVLEIRNNGEKDRNQKKKKKKKERNYTQNEEFWQQFIPFTSTED